MQINSSEETPYEKDRKFQARMAKESLKFSGVDLGVGLKGIPKQVTRLYR